MFSGLVSDALAQSLANAPLSGAVTAGTLGNSSPRTASKTVTFTGASGVGLHATNTVWFTVTGGLIIIDYIAGRVTTNLTGASATATLGVVGSTSLFVAATTATTLTTAAEIFASTTATAAGLAAPAATKGIIIDANIVSAMHATNDITGGVLEMNVIWRPLTPGATLV